MYPDEPKSNRAVISKMLCDQLVWAPFFSCVFFAVIKTLEVCICTTLLHTVLSASQHGSIRICLCTQCLQSLLLLQSSKSQAAAAQPFLSGHGLNLMLMLMFCRVTHQPSLAPYRQNSSRRCWPTTQCGLWHTSSTSSLFPLHRGFCISTVFRYA